MLGAMSRAPLRRRLTRALLGVALALGLLAALGAVLWSKAPEWGIPYARYTNDQGSACRTTWSGRICTPMTAPDISLETGLELPAGTVVERAESVQTHNLSVTARVVLPAGEEAIHDRLDERFGGCQKNQVNPLPAEWTKRCVRTSDGVRVDGAPPPTSWRVATAYPPDSDQLVIDLDVRSR